MEATHHPENKNKLIPLAQANCTTQILDDTKLADYETMANVQLMDCTRQTLAKARIVILPEDWMECHTNELYGIGNGAKQKMNSYPSLTDDSEHILTGIEESVNVISKQLLLASSSIEEHPMLKTSNEKLVKLINSINTVYIPENKYEHTQKKKDLNKWKESLLLSSKWIDQNFETYIKGNFSQKRYLNL